VVYPATDGPKTSESGTETHSGISPRICAIASYQTRKIRPQNWIAAFDFRHQFILHQRCAYSASAFHS